MRLPPARLPADLRLLLVHKQRTSARVRFLRFPHGVCLFSPLPAQSRLDDEDAPPPPVSHHPNAWLRTAAEWLGVPAEQLKPELEFQATVQTPSGPVAVQLVALDMVDPPFAAAAALGGQFVAITEARGCPPVDLELLRRAYAVVLG